MILEKIKYLKEFISAFQKVIVAYSGGIDSTVLGYIARDVLEENVTLLTIVSEFFINREKRYIENFIKTFSIKHKYIQISIINKKNIVCNDVNRCYYCKKEIFSNLLKYANNNDINIIFDGTNTDDLKEFRPGLKALDELNIIAPFIKTEIGKKDIYRIATHYGLDDYIRPSNTCLATRIMQDTKITNKKLKMVERAEEYMHDLGFKVVRVRYHYPDIARIEVLKESLKSLLDKQVIDSVVKRFKEIGFKRVSVDIEGYDCGKLDFCI